MTAKTFVSPCYGLRELLGPIIGELFELRMFGEAAGWPAELLRPLRSANLDLVEAVTDDELGLMGATPEQRVAAFPDRFPPSGTALPAFDSRRFTPYVQSIYAAELEAVRTSPASERRRQLQRSAYKLARIVAASALPADHVRESLVAAAADLPAEDAAAIIESAFRKGLANPRNLPTEETES